MTDIEKLFEVMKYASEQQKDEQQAGMDELGRYTRMMYDGFVHAGFSPKMAMELVKTSLTAALQSGLKK